MGSQLLVGGVDVRFIAALLGDDAQEVIGKDALITVPSKLKALAWEPSQSGRTCVQVASVTERDDCGQF